MQSILQQNTSPTCDRGWFAPRITQEQAEASFAKEGYKLLSQYKNAHTKLDFICSNGHTHSISWSSWNAGHRCKHCSKSKVAQKEEAVKQSFADAQYQLLSDYKDYQTKMDFICPNGHEGSISWRVWITGWRCLQCKPLSDRKQKQVEQSFTENGYQLLDQYTDHKAKMRTICPSGHLHIVTWTNFNNGFRCKQCAANAPISEKSVIESLESEGYKLLSSYTNVKVKITIECPNNHQYETTFDTWKHKGVRCLYCANKAPITQSFVEESFANEGYVLLSEYEKSSRKLKFQCPEGHLWHITWNGWQSGMRCGRCQGKHKTEEEKEISKIKATIARNIGTSLRRQKLNRTFSKSNFADRIAYNIYKTLGDRPEGHHLDHIIPRAFFDHRNMEEIEACWDVANLQWLPAKENASKGSRLTIEDAQKLNQYQKSLLAIATLKPKKLNKVL